jgi:hypothetical protein
MLVLSNLAHYVPIPATVIDDECGNTIVAGMQKGGSKIQVNPGIGPGLLWLQKGGWS